PGSENTISLAPARPVPSIRKVPEVPRCIPAGEVKLTVGGVVWASNCPLVTEPSKSKNRTKLVCLTICDSWLFRPVWRVIQVGTLLAPEEGIQRRRMRRTSWIRVLERCRINQQSADCSPPHPWPLSRVGERGTAVHHVLRTTMTSVLSAL